MLSACGEDVVREGLLSTPERYAKFMGEWLCQPEPKFTTFASEGMDEMVVQRSIFFWSLCEHHMLPFFGTGTIAYIPREKVVGLSKLARALRWCARGFQNQERITIAVADLLTANLDTGDVAVVLQAEHLCMSIRGVQAPGTVTVTECLRGAFRANATTRAEFLALAREAGR